MKHLLQRQLKHIATSDALRPAMTGIYFSGEELVATDGHKLIKYDPDCIGLDPESAPGIIPLSAFPRRQQDRYYTKIEAQDDGPPRVTIEQEGRPVITECLDEAYPNAEAVIPDERDAEYRICVNLEIFAELAKALPNDKDALNPNNAVLTFHQHTRAVTIEPMNPAAGWTKALVMPLLPGSDNQHEDRAYGNLRTEAAGEVQALRSEAQELRASLQASHDEIDRLREIIHEMEQAVTLSGDGQASEPPTVAPTQDREPVRIEQYSARGIALRGDVDDLTDALNRYGRKYESFKGEPAWIFSVKRLEWLEGILATRGVPVAATPA